MADKTFGSSTGLTILAENQATPANGMVAYITSSWNSGYQNGDIKGAFLSDTDDTDLVGGTDADRSVNANPLTVNGTVTRSPVATGAELVGYSGFSASNYLEQPYNSDLDFGTGDFCVMGWVNRGTDSWAMLLDRSDGGAIDGRFQLSLYPNSTCKLQFKVGAASLLTSATSLPENQWVHVAGFRSGNTGYVAINGVIDTNTVNLAAAIVDDSVAQAAKVRVGSRNLDEQQTLEGSLALLRISATAPTAEQIKKIYNDEKVLFQDGAKAVLAGTSDAVTALAYDDTTEELLVGTSQYTSVFRGLRRVDEISGSASAISTSNGLRVIED